MLDIHDSIQQENINCRVATNSRELMWGLREEPYGAYFLDCTEVFNNDLVVAVEALHRYGSAYMAIRTSDRNPVDLKITATRSDLQIPDYFKPAAAAALFMAGVRQRLRDRHTLARSAPPLPEGHIYSPATTPPRAAREYAANIAPAHDPSRIYGLNNPISPVPPPPRSNMAVYEKADPPIYGRGGADWLLRDRGWTLQSPKGQSVPLSTLERQLLLWFGEAEDGLITHGKEDRKLESGTVMNKRLLVVLISRLRAKCAAAGLAIPIYTHHRKGYQFAAPLKIETSV